MPPPWLHPDSLRDIVHQETVADPEGLAPPPPAPARADDRGNARSIKALGSDSIPLAPPFLPSCTADAPMGALPYHWFELAEMLLAHASDDIPAASEVRSLLKDLQEVRSAKLRARTGELERSADGVISLLGVGAMEVAESRGFLTGVIDGVRKLGASAEAARREEEGERGGPGNDDDEPSDDDMGL